MFIFPHCGLISRLRLSKKGLGTNPSPLHYIIISSENFPLEHYPFNFH